MHLLIEWLKDDPKAWSVVPKDMLADGTLRKSKDLVGRTVGIEWKRKVHQAVVLDSSNDQKYLEMKADKLAEEQLMLEKSKSADETRKRIHRETSGIENMASVSSSIGAAVTIDAKKLRANQILSVLDNIVPEIPVNNEVAGDVNSNDEDNSGINWQEKYNDCKSKLKNVRTKYKSLKEVHGRCTNEDEYVDIWEGCELKFRRSEIAALKTMSSSITFFARNLFRKAFSMEEIVGHSLLGRKSTALKDHAPLPSIDPIRRDAIIEFSLKSYGFVAGESSLKAQRKRKAAKTRIVKCLSDFFREENAKANKQVNIVI